MQVRLSAWQVTIERVRPGAEEIATRYDRLASRWQGKLQRLGYPRAYRRLFASLRGRGALAALDSTSRVLDCGIGTGALSVALRAEVPALARFHGVDLSTRMLAEARRNLSGSGVRTDLRRGDVCTLSQPSNHFDLVMSAHTIEHLYDPQVGVREMARVLRRGAPLLLVVTRRSWLTRWLATNWQVWATAPGELHAWLDDAGLTDIRPVKLPGAPWVDLMSIAAVGWKR